MFSSIRRLFHRCPVWLIVAGLILAACDNMPAPPPIARPVEEVMQDFTLFADPVAMLGERPPGTAKEAAEYYLQLFQPGDQLPRIFETTRIYLDFGHFELAPLGWHQRWQILAPK